MADNFPLTPGAGRKAATDQVTHSDEQADVQLIRSVGVTGAEGSKTVVDLALGAGVVTAGTPRHVEADDSPLTVAAVAIQAAVDGLEALVTTLNGVVATSANQDTGNTSLASILTSVDGIEALITTLNGLVTTLDGHVDGLETLLGSQATAANQATIIGHIDGIETALSGIASTLTSISGSVDGLEGFTDGLEGLSTTLNSLVTTLNTYVDGLESALAGVATETTLGAVKTSAELLDDIVHASDAALSKAAAIGAQFDDTAPGTTTENNVRPLRMSTRRELYVQVRDAAGNERGLNVDGNGAVAVTLASVPSHAVTNAGTFAVQDSEKIADDATFTPGTTKVQPAGGYVVAHGSDPDAADAGDAGAILMNRHRIPFVVGGHPNVQTVEYRWTTAQTDDAIVTASSGEKIVVTSIRGPFIDEAATVGVAARIGFGATTLATLATDGNAVSGILTSHGGLVPGGGMTSGDGSGILGVGADGEDLRITSEAPTSGDARVYISYYKVPS